MAKLASPLRQARAAPMWPQQIHDALVEHGVRQVCYVPDAGHARLIEFCRKNHTMRTVSLTTEEEGVAHLAGAWLGGDAGVLLMQSSGVGNCVNMLGLINEGRFPLLVLVTMRGDWGETNPWQVPMGQGTQAALENAGVIVYRADRAEDVAESVSAAARLAFTSTRAVAVLIGQRVIGTKVFR